LKITTSSDRRPNGCRDGSTGSSCSPSLGLPSQSGSLQGLRLLFIVSGFVFVVTALVLILSQVRRDPAESGRRDDPPVFQERTGWGSRHLSDPQCERSRPANPAALGDSGLRHDRDRHRLAYRRAPQRRPHVVSRAMRTLACASSCSLWTIGAAPRNPCADRAQVAHSAMKFARSIFAQNEWNKSDGNSGINRVLSQRFQDRGQ
jgi:hypothetical protein